MLLRFPVTLLVSQSRNGNSASQKSFLGRRLPLRLFRRRVQQGGLAVCGFLGKSQCPQPLCIPVDRRGPRGMFSHRKLALGEEPVPFVARGFHTGVNDPRFRQRLSFRVTTGKWLSSYDNYAILTIDVLSDGHPAVVHQDSLGQSTRRRSLAGMHRHAMTRWLGHPACRRFRNNIGAQTRPRSDNLVRQAARYVAPR
jgi:hypothetical protein